MNKLAMHFSLWIYTFHPHTLFLLSFKSHKLLFLERGTFGGPGRKSYLALVTN